MLEVTAEGWAATVGVITGLLLLDWVVLRRRSLTVGVAAAARWSVFYVAVSAAFGVVFGLINGSDLATQYFTGYLVELSLSVDNLFVFVIIIGSFAVPPAQQPKTLTIGIVLALGLRAVFIALGAALLQAFSFMFLIFGVALAFTAIQLFRHRSQDPHIEDNLVVAWARRTLPMSSGYDEGRIVTRRSGRPMLTPLFLALVAIGTTDLLFAFDSIPAVFGITDHAYIVFAANAFALLGLRPLYFLVSGLLSRLVYLSTGLALVLGFIGVKLILEFAHQRDHSIPEVPTLASLGVIVAVLTATTIASVIKSKRDPVRRAHAGSLRQGAQRDDAPDGSQTDPRGSDEVKPSA
jgi:TerC family integral membrane protein